MTTDGGGPADPREDPDTPADTSPTRIREHYTKIAPVARALGGLEAGGQAVGNADFYGWYRSRRPTPELSDEYDRIARGWNLDTDYTRLQGALDRVLYATTIYADPDTSRWRPFVWDDGDAGREWEDDENPLPGYCDLAAYAPFADIDLADEIKHQRPKSNIPRNAVEEALKQYIRTFTDLAGSRDAVYVLDSVGGAYVFIAPGATAPIAEYYNTDARGQVFSELSSRLNAWLEDVNEQVNAAVDGIEGVFEPDLVNNKNRLYKAPLSIHGSLDVERGDPEDIDEDIAEYGDETVILCTDQYSIYDGIDEYDEIDGHLAINNDEHYVVGDPHTNSCENRHSFHRNWLRRCRGDSKHYFQDYLNFLGWILNSDN